MALGNWATLAIRLDGTVIDTVEVDWPVSVCGVFLQIYKNWVYVNDETVPKRPNDSYSGSVVMEVQHGSLTYADWKILACRGPQDGIYLAAWSSDYRKENSHRPMVGFVGCGVYGYEDQAWIGVLPSSVGFLKGWLASVKDELPDEVSKVLVPDGTFTDQGEAFFRRNVPKLLSDKNFDPEKAR